MLTPTSNHLELAERLLRIESDAAAAAGRVHEAIARVFSPVIGAAAVRALFVRSVKQCAVEHGAMPDVVAAAIEEQGATFARGLAEREAADARRTALAFYAMFLALTSNFIGESLTLQILKSAFPELESDASKENDS